MITVRLYGGLGNQLFQFATGYSISRRLNCAISFDSSHYNRNNHRKLELNDLNVPRLTQINFTKSSLLKINQKLASYSIAKSLLRTNIIKELSPYIVDHRILSCGSPSYLDGYWQNPNYFNSYKSELQQLFKPESHHSELFGQTEQLITQSNSVCLHIRRGDFVNNPISRQRHYVCDISYYQSAIEHVKNRLKNPVFYIFSDDIDWVKGNLKFEGQKYFLPKSLALAEEFELMKKCSSYIISNSTFSWWATWLTTNQNRGLFIFPKKWINGDDNYEDLYFSKQIVRI